MSSAAVGVKVTWVHSDAAPTHPVLLALAPLRAKVEQVARLADALDRPGRSCLLIDYDALPHEDRDLLERRLAGEEGLSERVVVVGESCRRDFSRLLGLGTLSHLVAVGGAPGASLLPSSLRTMSAGGPLLLEHYFPRGGRSFRQTLAHPDERAALLSLATRFTLEMEVHPRLAAAFCAAIDEVLTPALAQDEGSAPRGVEAATAFPEPIEVRFCIDAHRLGFGVTSPHGGISRRDVLESLAGSHRTEVSPAPTALALQQLSKSLSHLLLRSLPGGRREVIGLLQLAPTFREFARAEKSFHLFG